MANVTLLWDKASDRGTLSGGSWVSGLPLNSLQTPDVQAVARSTSASTAHTRFVVDLGTVKPEAVSGFALLNHNGSTASKWRIVVTDDASDTNPALRKLDTGLMNMWVETVVFGSAPWGSFPWDGIDQSRYPGGTIALYFAPSYVIGRYIWIYIEDAANAAGYFQAGRFLAGQTWAPAENAAYGASIRYIDPSEVRRTRGGARLTSPRPRYRQFSLSFPGLTQAEALGTAFEIDRQIGKTGDFLLVMDPEEDGVYRFRRTIYAALSDTSPIAIPNFEEWSWSITAEELI